MSNSYKSFCYLFGAILLIPILLVFHSQLAIFLISLIAPEIAMEPDVLETNRYIRCHNIVVYSGTGIVLFNLLCSLKYFLLEKHLYRSQLLKYSYLATLIMQVVAIFVFTDIVLQNWGGCRYNNIDFFDALSGHCSPPRR